MGLWWRAAPATSRVRIVVSSFDKSAGHVAFERAVPRNRGKHSTGVRALLANRATSLAGVQLHWPFVSLAALSATSGWVQLSTLLSAEVWRAGMKVLERNATYGPFLERLRSAPSRVLLLDYDGTLAPFVVDRTLARPYPEIPPLIGRIMTQGTRVRSEERRVG